MSRRVAGVIPLEGQAVSEMKIRVDARRACHSLSGNEGPAHQTRESFLCDMALAVRTEIATKSITTRRLENISPPGSHAATIAKVLSRLARRTPNCAAEK